MEIKYTPGPWHTEKARIYLMGGDAPCINIVANDNGVTARLYQLRRDLTESEANAKLISAAPELLEALQGAFIILSDLQRDNVNEPDAGIFEDTALTETYLNVVNAIKKATK